MSESTGTTSPVNDARTTPEPVTFYWLVTIETTSGKQVTCDGTMPAVPGQHTRMSTTRAVMNHLKDMHGDLVVLFLLLEPNDIPAVTA